MEKSGSITFRGFEVAPTSLEEIIGRKAETIGIKGAPCRPGHSAVLRRSYAVFSMSFGEATRIREMIPKLIEHFGGIEEIARARITCNPEFIDIDLRVPAELAEDQDSGYFSPSTIADLAKIGCSLSFSFA